MRNSAGGALLPGTAIQESEYDSSSVVNLTSKKLVRVEHIQNPLKVKVLNLVNNSLASMNDIQLW